MDIETIKNELKEHILDSVQEDAKNATISWLNTTVLPAAKEVADAYTAALQESAGKETWLEQIPRPMFPADAD
jgi:hypothetical protein